MKPLPLVAFAVLFLVPLFFLRYEIVCIVGWPESLVRELEPWVPAIMAMVTALTALFVPWIAHFLGDQD